MEWQFVENWPALLGAAFFLYWLTVLVVLVNDQRDPTKTLAWLVLLSFLPVLGLALYYFFGRNWRKIAELRGLHERHRAMADPTMRTVHARHADTAETGRKWAEDRG